MSDSTCETKSSSLVTKPRNDVSQGHSDSEGIAEPQSSKLLAQPDRIFRKRDMSLAVGSDSASVQLGQIRT